MLSYCSESTNQPGYRFLIPQKVQINWKNTFLLLRKCNLTLKMLSYYSESANHFEYHFPTARKVQINLDIAFLLLRKCKST